MPLSISIHEGRVMYWPGICAHSCIFCVSCSSVSGLWCHVRTHHGGEHKGEGRGLL